VAEVFAVEGRVPDPALVERAKRRKSGEVGELLRREGLYTSRLTYWRKQRNDGALQAGGVHGRISAAAQRRR
jgi:hypothetical protein